MESSLLELPRLVIKINIKIINMPYSYHKEGDKYVVTKKDTGKEVGRTKGTKEALKNYLAALHKNANEGKTNTMKKSELTKMIQEVIKEVISEQTNTTPKHKIIAQLMGPDFFLSKKPESTWDEKDHDLFNRISKMASEEGKVPKMSESADYDTAVAFRLVAKGNRDQALEALQSEINRITGPSGRFSKVKVTVIPSKGNPQDIIIKLNGPSAFSMGKDITAKDKTKAYTNPTIRNNFSKVSPYTPQLTKIS
jgi:hypothetical protein